MRNDNDEEKEVERIQRPPKKRRDKRVALISRQRREGVAAYSGDAAGDGDALAAALGDAEGDGEALGAGDDGRSSPKSTSRYVDFFGTVIFGGVNENVKVFASRVDLSNVQIALSEWPFFLFVRSKSCNAKPRLSS